MRYEITKIRLDGVPKIPYKDGVGKHRGVCAHATANYGGSVDEDTAIAEKNWEQGHWNDAFVHYFCDYTSILDVADDDYISYGCSGGNPYFINVELCQTKHEDRFNESYNRWIFIMAKVLYDNKLGVIDGVTLVSHRWVSQHYSGSHDDPHAYIESHSKVWADVVVDVTKVYEQFENDNFEEDDKVVFTHDFQWEMLTELLNDTYQKSVSGELTPPLLSDYSWVQKAYDRTLTQSDLAWLTIVLFSKDKGIIKP